MRHGERADLVEGLEVKNHINDPEITERGKRQTNEAGVLLLSNLIKITNKSALR